MVIAILKFYNHLLPCWAGPSVGENSEARGDNPIPADGILTRIRSRVGLVFLIGGEGILKVGWWRLLLLMKVVVDGLRHKKQKQQK